MSEVNDINEVAKIIGRRIKCFAICGTQLDITFDDNTKIYDLLNHPRWIHFNDQGYPDYEKVERIK